MRSISSLPILASLLVSLVSVEPADACSPPPCWAGGLLPADGATIPANAPALYWRPSSGGTPGEIRLTAVGDAQIPLTSVKEANSDAYVLTPSTPLVAGMQYVLEDTGECLYQQPLRSTFMVGPAAPLPTSLGTTQRDGAYVRGDISVATAGGSCSIELDAASATITLTHSADAEPWKDLFVYETLVDSQLWTPHTAINVSRPLGASWRGRARDQLYRVCVENNGEGRGLDEGTHEAAFRAYLPGQAKLVATSVNVDTICDPSNGSNGSGSGSNDPGTPTDSGGCCSTSGSSANVAWVALLGLLLRRRRRH
jgi:MYXO-CTERM domain-containing protein